MNLVAMINKTAKKIKTPICFNLNMYNKFIDELK